MSKLTEIDRPPIAPVYFQIRPNQPIELTDLRVRFTCEDKTYEEVAKVVMDFLPDDHLWFFIPRHDVEFVLSMFGHAEGIEFALPERAASLKVLYHGTNVGKDVSEAFISQKSVATVTRLSESISTAVFHVFNFPDFHGPEDYWWKPDPAQEAAATTLSAVAARMSGTPCGHVILQAGGWKITIAAISKTPDLLEAVAREGGYVITHMGRIEREDGSEFSTGEFEDLLRCIYLFLSFVLGRRAGVAFPLGLDADGNRVFEQWGLPIVAPGGWHGSLSWFDASHSELLSGVFPGFLALWKNDSWREHLRKTLYWYLAANERGTGIGVDAGIILAQTALERLAWAHCVEARKIVSQEAFKPRGLSAADRLRMLTSTLGIPVEIPKTMKALCGRPGTKWADIPDAITAIRNALVHPYEKKSPPTGAYYDGWRLSMWLLDLVLLCLCNHNGEYGNRIADLRYAGLVERVPWAK